MEARVRSLERREFTLDASRTRALYEQSPDAVLVLDPESGVVLAGNRAAGDLFGREPHALAGRAVESFAPPEARGRRVGVWEAIARGARLRDADIDVIRADGRRVEASVSTTTARDSLGVAIAYITVWRDISRRRGVEREVRDDRRHLRALARELSVAEERERKRIASGLHDEIGQVLAIARLKLGELGRRREGTSDAELIDDIRELVDEASRAARTATFELSCPVLQQLGLEAAIENLGSRIERAGELRFRFTCDGGDPPFSVETLAILYRATRELLVNAEKHACARSVEVAMRLGADRFTIRVEDDGVGFAASEHRFRPGPAGGFGLFSITAQMRGIGGCLAIDSSPGRGTRAELVVSTGDAGS